MSFIFALLQKIEICSFRRTSRSTRNIRTWPVVRKPIACAARTRRCACTVADRLMH